MIMVTGRSVVLRVMGFPDSISLTSTVRSRKLARFGYVVRAGKDRNIGLLLFSDPISMQLKDPVKMIE